ncbi:GNAT family N-acetyltransferase [Streptomyces sp. NEAU-NA10]|uniref:GNAT family N-acetyltransferase n=1 Tax=Streptomyces sp. NEAU-NA10 TaxID=3416050 RepID=UPI003CC62344
MRLQQYAGPQELRAMQSLATRVFPRTGYHHIGDLAWNRCLALGREEHCPTAVWERGGETLAWAWLELPDGALMVQVDPAHPELAGDVLAWAEQKAPGLLTVEVAGTETHLVEALNRRGYRQAADGPFMACLTRPLTALPAIPPLPDGYVIRPQRDTSDVAGRAAAHRAAFGSPRITAERHARMRDTWPYRPELDLIVVSPAGDVVAYCQGWYDDTNRIGAFEPVGTHPDHRRRGLARAVCTAVLHAFAAAGGRRAVVQARGDADHPAPKRLYESMGFRAYTRTYAYLA